MTPFSSLARGHFQCVVFDPPWHHKARSAKGEGRSAKRHYAVMEMGELMKLPVLDVCARDCHLFLWATGPMLPQAFRLMDVWGFTYSGMGFVWIKLKRSIDPNQLRMMATAECDLHFGLGHTTRKNCEFVLLGRRGNPKRNAKNIREPILSPVRQHSRKPDEFYRRVTTYCDGPYLDGFSREDRPGWTAWGLEEGKFGAHRSHRQELPAHPEGHISAILDPATGRPAAA